ncbi:hypothetical protein [Amycolatopsis sp. NPDC059021]|uniref:hypothetical protein n=1 Tax=Amycolatopsis sp. NPDC059021 TaxID=3346704 RepID=UPI003670D5F8
MSNDQILMHFEPVLGQVEEMRKTGGLDSGSFTDVYQHAKDANASFFSDGNGEAMVARHGVYHKAANEHLDQLTALGGKTADSVYRSQDCVQSCAATWT